VVQVDMAHLPLTRTAYTDAAGGLRELVVCPAAHGSLLVIDRDASTLCDQRLVAHIPADEPRENAALVGSMYARERGARRCRPLFPEDLVCAPPALGPPVRPGGASECVDRPIRRNGQLYGIRVHRARSGMSLLRWSRRAEEAGAPWRALTLREVLGALESYEPACSLTLAALGCHVCDPGVSVAVLRRELDRVHASAFVLNRGLREAVLGTVERGEASMSEIAARCGMVKRDRRGLPTGDTTWLARRIGLLPEGGRKHPTRWVHSDVLGQIARRGLGVSPREVEL
jgi:hypothetical protein